MESTDALLNKSQPSPEEWNVPFSRTHTDDPLLHALVIITKLLHKPFSIEALTAGLPLDKNSGMTPELFIRAAARAGFSANRLKKSLTECHGPLLPAVLLMKNKRACVLVSMTSTHAQVIYPETGMGKESLPIEQLAADYQGYCIVLKPTYQFTDRTHHLEGQRYKRWFWDVIEKSWPILSEVCLASFLINFFALASPLFIMNVYDRVVPNHATATLWTLALGVTIVFLFDFMMRNTRSYFIDHAGKKIDSELSAKIYEQLLGLKMDSRPPSVGALSNIVNAFDSFREFITSATVSVLIDVPFAILFVLVIWYIGGPLALVSLIAIPIIIGTSILIQIPFNRLIQTAQRHSAEKQATIYESLTNIETIKTHNAESTMQHRFETLTDDASTVNVRLHTLSGATLSIAQLTQQIATMVTVIAGVYLVTQNALSVGGLMACTILTSRALVPMSQIASLITRFHQSMAALKTLDEIMKAPIDRERGKAPLQRERFRGEIELRQLSFNYPKHSIPALKNISFKIKAGERVGLVGRIGSGKTTLEKLLVGLYRPSNGNILVDGVDISQLDITDLRGQIGYIPQDIELFHGTIRDNITLGAPYVDDVQVVQAARISGVDQFVDTHPDGFDRNVGERGNLLSGGQRQSIIVARALLMDPPIIVMDEPTNLMDDKTESNLRTRLENYLQNKTLILVTHRASMLGLVNRLIVLDKGLLVADGSKEYVLNALSDGRVKTTLA